MTQTTAHEGQPRGLRVRNLDIDFSGVPRHWFGGSAVATHIANGINLLFPAGERFFVRSVRHYVDEVKDPELRARIKGFFGQEGRHAKEHDVFNKILEQRGLEVRRFLAVYERVCYGLVERVSSPELRLASTAAAEHFTAMLAENALTARFFDVADPAMRDLLLWHASEEIEHRAVAYDVLQQVNPSYRLRVAGLALAGSLLCAFWAAGAVTLLAQEKTSARELGKEWLAVRKNRRELGGRNYVFAHGIRQYLQRDFHPSHNDVDHLAAEYLASVGLPAAAE